MLAVGSDPLTPIGIVEGPPSRTPQTPQGDLFTDSADSEGRPMLFDDA